MASNLCRRFSSPIARSEFPISASRQLICTTTQLFQSLQPEKNEAPIADHKEKNQNQIEDEEKHDSKADEIDEDDDGLVNKQTGEVGGPRGPEPTRYGDWEKGGRCCDF